MEKGRENPPPGGAKPRKSRPTKSVRDAAKAARAQALPEQPHPSTGSHRLEQAKSFAAATSAAPAMTGAPVFRPGSFPVLFNASAPEATVDVKFIPNAGKIGTHANFVYKAIQNEDRFNTFLANAGFRDDLAEEKFISSFESASLLCAAQSVCEAHKVADFPVGDFGPLVSSDLVHLRSIRVITGQYGDTRVDRVGHRYVVHHYNDVVKAMVRQALHTSIAEDEFTRQTVRDRWWLPTSRHDGRVRFYLACKMAEVIKSRDVGFIPDVEFLENKILGRSAATPPVWLASVFNETEQNILRPLWEMFPNEAGFVTLFSAELQALLGITWNAPDSSHLGWTLNHKEESGKLLAEWAKWTTLIRQFFMTAGREVISGSPGSYLQLGSFETLRGVHIAHHTVDAGQAQSSLASAFTPESVHSPSKERDVTLVTTSNIAEKSITWIQLDVK